MIGFSPGILLAMVMTVVSASAQQIRLVTPIGHTGIIKCVAFSPDGERIVTGAADNTALIWDAASGKLLAVLAGHTRPVTSVSFSSNGRYILTSSTDETARIWDARTGNLIRTSVTNGRHAAFSPDSEKIVVSGVLNTSILSIETGETLVDFLGDTEPGTGASIFSPDGKRIICLGDIHDEYVIDDNKAGLFDVETGEAIQTLSGHKEVIAAAAYSNDGKKIVTGAADGQLMIWDGQTGKSLVSFKGHQRGINTLQFNWDGKYFLSASNDGTAAVWHTSTGKILYSLKGHKDDVISACFSQDGKYVVTASTDNTAMVWQMSTGKLTAILAGHSKEINAIAISPVSYRVVTGSSDFTARLWDMKSHRLISEMAGNNAGSKTSVFLPSDSLIFSATTPPEIWNRYSGKIERSLNEIRKNGLSYISYSGDGKKLLTVFDVDPYFGTVWDVDKAKLVRTAFDTAAIIWDAASARPLIYLKGHENSVLASGFSNDGSRVVTGSRDSSAIVWDAETGKVLHRLKDPTGQVEGVSFSPNDSMVATISSDGSVRAWNAITGQLISALSVWSGRLNSASFSPDGTKIVTAAYGIEYAGHIWNVQDGTIAADLLSGEGGVPLEEASTCSASYSPDGKWILTNSPFAIWNAETGKQVTSVGYRKIQLACFSKDSKRALSVSQGNTIQIWNVADTEPETKDVVTLSGHTGDIYSATFSNNSREVLSTSEDGTSRLWDAKTGKLISVFIRIGKEDQFILTQDGFYQATHNAVKNLHYVTEDLKIIGFDQLDARYNRPDKVLIALGNTDSVMILGYRRAWEKRMKKLNMDTSAFRLGYAVPQADFHNRDRIDFDRSEEKLLLRIRGADSLYLLDRFNVWVNGCPLFSQRGISIRSKNSNTLDTTITIILSAGQNKVETSVTNVAGSESYRIPLYLNYSPSVRKNEFFYFTGIGIDRFSDSRHNLQYCSKDIRDLARKFKLKYKEKAIIDTLFNEQVTVENVKAVKQKLRQTTENDRILLVYSGHGLLSRDFDYYLSTFSTNFEVPEQGGLPYEDLESLLDSIPARKKLLLIDACHSGEVDKEDLVQLEEGRKDGVKALKPVVYKKEGQMGLQNSFELMQSLFVNLSKGTGATVISAAAGTQFALERADLKNGVFTFAIMEALDKYPRIKVSELRKMVGARVEELTNGAQKPTSRSEPVEADWEL